MAQMKPSSSSCSWGIVVCHAMDRLARNLNDLRKIVLVLTERESMSG